ncbi:hypothetical protein RUND412_008342 [Rhizina undulata]
MSDGLIDWREQALANCEWIFKQKVQVVTTIGPDARYRVVALPGDEYSTSTPSAEVLLEHSDCNRLHAMHEFLCITEKMIWDVLSAPAGPPIPPKEPTPDGVQNLNVPGDIGEDLEKSGEIKTFAGEPKESPLVMLINDGLRSLSYQQLPKKAQKKWMRVLTATESEIIKTKQEAETIKAELAITKSLLSTSKSETLDALAAARKAKSALGEEEIRKIRNELGSVCLERDESRRSTARVMAELRSVKTELDEVKSEQRFWALEASKLANKASEAREALEYVKTVLHMGKNRDPEACPDDRDPGRGFSERIRNLAYEVIPIQDLPQDLAASVYSSGHPEAMSEVEKTARGGSVRDFEEDGVGEKVGKKAGNGGERDTDTFSEWETTMGADIRTPTTTVIGEEDL